MDNYVQLSTGIYKMDTFIEFHKLNKTTCFILKKSSKNDTSYVEEIYKGSDCDILERIFQESSSV